MWAVCNGQTFNTYTYRTLHSIISNTYGGTAYQAGVTDQPGATTTFNIPNMANQFAVGSSGDGGTDIDGTLKRTGGTKVAKLVTHKHPLSGDGGHPHGLTIADNAGIPFSGNADNQGPFTLTGTASGNAPHTHPVTLTGGGHSHTYSKFGVDSRKVSGGDGVQIDENNANRDVGGDGSHTHSSPTGAADATTPFSGTVTVSGATHGHGVSGTTGSHGHPGSAVTGTGTHPHTVELSGGISEDNSENLPPYFALFYIMRII